MEKSKQERRMRALEECERIMTPALEKYRRIEMLAYEKYLRIKKLALEELERKLQEIEAEGGKDE